jgi:tRNA uridine 5-carboxymethylaminomethyl modification enzyme
MPPSYHVIVVGAGHAGCEAAYAAARLDKKVLMVSLSKKHIGRLSCNPAVGGLAKGNLVREIDALGGIMAKVTDRASIQFRRLNTRKGLAVQASRAQVDIDIYPKEMAQEILNHPNIEFLEGEAAEVQMKSGQVHGLLLADGQIVYAPSLIITTGTFLSGVLHCGEEQLSGGRIGENAAKRLSKNLLSLGLRLGRLKTGTTPRLNAKTIDWSKTERQEEIVPDGRFSFSPQSLRQPQVDCHIAYTNEQTHSLIRKGLARSPLYTGQITGRGPRYCPSIEDKIVRFPDRKRHLLFLEPEGLNTDLVYVNGLSTSLPKDLQENMVRSISGLENAEILQYGYAVEYDYANPLDLTHSLEHKKIPGLFLAGQINGTSGYEEAAAQGLVAGISAATGTEFRLGRDQAYIGVLIDDLVTKGVGGEPYRMFSSRAEHRLLLREDNADRRLCPIAKEWNLLSEEEWKRFCTKRDEIQLVKEWTLKYSITPTSAVQEICTTHNLPTPRCRVYASDLLKRTEITWDTLSLFLTPPITTDEVIEQVCTDIKYSGYLEREKRKAEHTRKSERIRIPEDLSFDIPGISFEVAERLTKSRPQTLGAASRLPGITPAAIDTLALYLAKREF